MRDGLEERRECTNEEERGTCDGRMEGGRKRMDGYKKSLKENLNGKGGYKKTKRNSNFDNGSYKNYRICSI
jgi:hypothetical protein